MEINLLMFLEKASRGEYCAEDRSVLCGKAAKRIAELEAQLDLALARPLPKIRADKRIEELEHALREAIGWNWLEHEEKGNIPEGVLQQIDKALNPLSAEDGGRDGE